MNVKMKKTWPSDKRHFQQINFLDNNYQRWNDSPKEWKVDDDVFCINNAHRLEKEKEDEQQQIVLVNETIFIFLFLVSFEMRVYWIVAQSAE